MKVVYHRLGKSSGGNGSNYKYKISRTITNICWLKGKGNSVIFKEHIMFWSKFMRIRSSHKP